MVSADDVAVVIPVYNGVGIVDRCISALLRQSRVPGEIICVDDFSRDNTYEYIRRRFPDITLVRNGFNMGASGSYAKGIILAVSKGYKLIWLLDQDDLPSRKALEELLLFPLVGKAILTPILVCPLLNSVYDMLDFSCGMFAWRRPDLNRPHEILLSNFSGMLLPDKLVDSVGVPSPKLRNEVADWEFSIRVRSRGWRIIRVPRSVVYHVGGKPRLGPRVYRRRYLRLRKMDLTRLVEVASSKLVLISNYPKERYFERGRNITFLLKSIEIPSCMKIFMLKWVLGTLIKVSLFESERREKMRAYLIGLLSGIIVT